MDYRIYKTDDTTYPRAGGFYYKKANFYIGAFDDDTNTPVDGDGGKVTYQKRTVYNGTTINRQQFTVTVNENPILIFSNDNIYKDVAQGYDQEIIFNIVSIVQPCDLAGSSTHTDETGPLANDGTITANYTSSYGGIQYSLDFGPFQNSNTYTGLAPGSYVLRVRDANGCIVFEPVNIEAFPLPNDKRFNIQYYSIKDKKSVEINIYNPLAEDAEVINVEGNAVKSYQNNDDQKYSPIISAKLDIMLTFRGDFDIDIFQLASERRYKVDLYYDGVLDFQGWLLTDQVKDLYLDPPYDISLSATDGVSSLKGIDFSDLNGNRIFGITPVLTIFNYIFSKLGYDYGQTTLITSLNCTQSAGNLPQQWNNLSVWGEMFYDQDGTPDDCYTALVKLLDNHLTCFQHKGSFVLFNPNDFVNSSVESYILTLSENFGEATMGGLSPEVIYIAPEEENKAANANHTIFRESAFSILDANAEFNLLSLLYPDPSFEYNQTQGQIPFGWTKVGSINSSISDDDYYDGANSLYTSDSFPTLSGTNTDYIYYPVIIDQLNKKINISFKFKPIYREAITTTNVAYQIFLDGNDGRFYTYRDPDLNQLADGESPWKQIPSSRNDTSLNVTGVTTDDYAAWNDFSASTTAMPSSGTVYFCIKKPVPKIKYFDPFNPYMPSGVYTYFLDELVLTVSDATEGYNLQLSETNRFTNLDKYNFSPKEQRNFDLFTYADNKRVAGNLFYGLSYGTAQITKNMWRFLSFSDASLDTYQVAVTKQITRGTKQPSYVFEGDIYSDTIDFFCLFIIYGLGNRKFIPLKMDIDYRGSKRSVTLAEINNAASNYSLQYIPKYQKNARKNQ